jgi:hypothetical protein
MIYLIVVCCSIAMFSPLPHPVVAILPTPSAVVIVVVTAAAIFCVIITVIAVDTPLPITIALLFCHLMHRRCPLPLPPSIAILMLPSIVIAAAIHLASPPIALLCQLRSFCRSTAHRTANAHRCYRRPS